MIDAWGQYIEEKVTIGPLAFQKEFFHRQDSTINIQSWAVYLVQHLLSITHRPECEDTYQESRGWTEQEHTQSVEDVKQIMLIILRNYYNVTGTC